MVQFLILSALTIAVYNVIEVAVLASPLVAARYELARALPSVKNWGTTRMKYVIRFTTRIVESLALTGVFMVAYYSIPGNDVPFEGTIKGGLFALALILVQTIPKAATLYLRTNYPTGLLRIEIGIHIITRIAIGLTLGLAYRLPY